MIKRYALERNDGGTLYLCCANIQSILGTGLSERVISPRLSEVDSTEQCTKVSLKKIKRLLRSEGGGENLEIKVKNFGESKFDESVL